MSGSRRAFSKNRFLAALLALAAASIVSSARALEWVRPGINTNQPVWGIRGALQWALPPGGFPPPGGPRGLIRLGFPTTNAESYQLFNFIAIEPIVGGVRGFSELEPSRLDHEEGKRLWSINPADPAAVSPGTLSHPAPGVEELSTDVAVERFDNGAEVSLTIAQRSDAPNEIRLAIHATRSSADLDYCILTATMGNKARLRQLHLRDRLVTSRELYPDYTGPDFAPHKNFPLAQLALDAEGNVLVSASNDEENPSAVSPFPGHDHWRYLGPKLTQYWKQTRANLRHDLECVVNGRYVYWKSQQPIPGGIAFENFELREKFFQGQEFIFGVTNAP